MQRCNCMRCSNNSIFAGHIKQVLSDWDIFSEKFGKLSQIFGTISQMNQIFGEVSQKVVMLGYSFPHSATVS